MTPRRKALYASAAAALVSALLVASLTATPVSAETATGNAELDRALTQLADCEAMRAGATTSRQRAWGNDCIAMARAWIDRLTASPTPSPTSSPSPTPTASPSPTATTPPPSPTPSPPAGCALPAYPTPACTGTPAGWTPTRIVSGDYTANEDGEIIDGWRITGAINVRAQNVTVRNSEIYGRIYNQVADRGYNGLLIEHSTIGPPSGNSGETTGAIGVGGYHARYVHIRNSPEGFRVGGYSHSGGRLQPVTIEHSYVRLMNVGCDHSDGVQEYDWRPNSTVIVHNTIDMRGVSCATSPLYIGYGGVAKDNLLMGGAYVMRIYRWHAQAVYTQVSGNRIVNGTWDGGTGPTLVETCSIISSWRDNRLATIDSAYRVTAGSLLTRCPEDTGSLGSAFP